MVAPSLGCIQRASDFQRVLATTPRVRSAHFALHHLAACPSLPGAHRKRASGQELSTGGAPACPPPVDESGSAALGQGLDQRPADVPVSDARPAGCWLGLVVPKRHARRAVTRNLIKRQVRALMAAAVPSHPHSAVLGPEVKPAAAAPADHPSAALEPGLWVMRLKAPFDPSRFPSASSDALRAQVRVELQELLLRARQGQRDQRPRGDGSSPASGRAGRARPGAAAPAA